MTDRDPFWPTRTPKDPRPPIGPPIVRRWFPTCPTDPKHVTKPIDRARSHGRCVVCGVQLTLSEMPPVEAPR